MFCKLKNLAIVSLVSTLLPLAATAADVNDNYSTAVVEKWVNDSSDQAVQLLDIMTCISGRGGISQPGFANKSWIGIVDETSVGSIQEIQVVAIKKRRYNLHQALLQQEELKKS